MKKILKSLIDIAFVVSLALLGKFNSESFVLSSYQIVITIFWMTGILKFMGDKGKIKVVLVYNCGHKEFNTVQYK